MSQRTIAIPRLLHVGNDCISDVAQLLKERAFDLRRVCVGFGPGPSRELAGSLIDGLRSVGVDVVEAGGLSGTLDQAADIAALIIREDASLVVAVGGGRVIDTVKLAAGRTGIEFISVPTTISHDGISSPVASLRGDDGVRRSYAAAMPSGVIVDLRIIAAAPPQTLRAGVGDLVSNLTAVLDWRLAAADGQERYDAFPAMIAESAARPALDLVDLSLPASHELIANGLLLSGLAMAAAGTSRPCSGAEHLISHSLDALLGKRAAMHGEQVALGCIVAAAAHDSSLLETLRGVFVTLGLPTRPEDLGLSIQEMERAVAEAPATRPERYTILSRLEGDGPRRARLLGRAFAAG